jgi:O-antigen/teichoic acid export membrane protein
MPSFARNIVASYAGKAINLILALAVVPLQIKFLGTEAFGLIGLYASLLGLMMAIDTGLSSTVNREIARLSASPQTAGEINDVGRTMEPIYWGLALVIGGAIALGASPIAHHWLNTSSISPATTQYAIVLIGLVVALQWPVNLYSGCLLGLQRLVLVNQLNVGFAILRSAAGLGVLWLIEPSIHLFFLSQAAIALAQVAGFALAYRLVRPHRAEPPRFRFAIIRRVAGFAAGVGGTYLLSIPLSYTDKAVLSRLLPLQNFGYYTLAGTVAGGISIMAAPMLAAAFPRFSVLVAENDRARLAELYHRCSNLVAIGVFATAAVMAFFAHDLLYLWVGRIDVADGAWLPLTILCVGMALNNLMTVPSALMLASGWATFGVWQNAISVVVIVPLTIVLALNWGGVGAAAAWTLLNLAYILIGVPILHRRLMPGATARWFLQDLGRPLAAAILVAGAWRLMLPASSGRLAIAGVLGTVGATTLLATALASPALPPLARNFLRKRMNNSAGTGS